MVQASKSSLPFHKHPAPVTTRRLALFYVALTFLVILVVDAYWSQRIWVFNVGLRASVSKPSAQSTAPMPARSKEARAQHLLLDLANCSEAILNDAAELAATLEVLASHLDMQISNKDVVALEPQGFGVVANLGDSHLTLHTWPKSRDALVSLLVADEDNSVDLRSLLPVMSRLLQGNLDQSTFSIIPRGRDIDVSANKAYSPEEIMTLHKYKRQIHEVQSPFQNVAIWDHHDTLDDSTSRETTRSLFLDGVMQSNIEDEFQYHETLVQPAFIATAEAPKRVLIVGGGEGGTLRETLKWKSVEQAVMVDLDAEVIRASRQHLPTYSNCTGFGTPSCFEDPRVSLYTEDFFKWFDNHIGDDICANRHKKKDSLFDVIILDLLDTEELPEGQAWAEYLYSKLFFERISCAVTDLGVVISNFGESPENPFEPSILLSAYSSDDFDKPRLSMFSRKMDQLRSMSQHFLEFRVYDTFVPAFRYNWAFAIGMVPRVTSRTGEITKRGISYFDGSPVQVNHKLRQNLLPQVPMEYYDGVMQQAFRQPVGGWRGAFCQIPNNEKACRLKDRFFDDESSLWQVKKSDKDAPSVEALVPLKQKAILGAWDGVVPGAAKISTAMEASCDFNTVALTDAEPWLAEAAWNPALDRIRSELTHAVVLLRDVKAGEQLTRKASNCAPPPLE